MPTITQVRNGVANPRKRRKRRNPTTATATANPRRRRRRRNPSASVTTHAANPAKATANPRKRRRRRNPSTAIVKANPRRRTRRRRNGIFGDSKAEVKQVLSILGGLAGTKVVGGIASPYVSQLLAYVGMSKFAQPVTDAVVAVVAVSPVAGMIGGRDAAKLARLGGLAVAGLDLLQMVLPSGFAYSPFAVNSTPIVLASGGITPNVAKQIAQSAVAEVAAGSNPNNTASKVGMIFDNMGAQRQNWNVGNSPVSVPRI